MTVCPACGMEVGGKDKACPRCGWEFNKRVKFDCPFCGELIPVESRICPSCGIDLSTLPMKARSHPIDIIREALLADRHVVRRAATKKRVKRFRCPRCAALLDGTESTCPECSQFLISESGLKCPVCSTLVEKRRRKCPKCGLALATVRREALQMIPYAAEPEAEPSVKPSPSLVTDLIAQKVELEAKVVEKTQEPQVVEAQPPLEPKTKLRTSKGPKPDVEKITTVDLVEGRGVSDTLSKVNGRGRTNGAAAADGKSFVNGTGISTGPGPQRKGVAAWFSTSTRWQLVAVLVVVALVIPTLAYFSIEGKKENYAIDGNFSDWAHATVFGTRIQSTSPSSNITEWAVAAQTTGLYVYFKTESQMMGSSEVESYYLFVDSDGSNGTGYVIESIGADYMLQLTGWNNAVDSSSLSSYSSSDRFDWNSWTHVNSLSYAKNGLRIEARASLPVALQGSAMFVLVSKDSMERGSVSYVAPLKGPLLIVEQAATDQVALGGVVPKAASVDVLKIRFRCEGGGGQVNQVHPRVVGGFMVGQIQSFSLGTGESREVTIAVDTSAFALGQLVSVDVPATGIDSSFASVQVEGSGASAYVGSPPSTIVIDGAFADWNAKLSADQDSHPVSNPNVDINEVGNVSTSQNSYFYVSVQGEMCSGSYVPAMVLRPSGAGGGGGTVIPARKTAEDVLKIYVDSDRSNTTGESVELNAKQIGADQMIEVKGLFGRITSVKEFNYSPSDWVETSDVVNAAKDAKRIEIEITSASLQGSSDIDFIVETTSWKGRCDLATFDPSSMKALTATWILDSPTTSSHATSMSYQRKMFYDGVNFWSFFFNGTNTVCKYSVDEGATWVYSGPVFTSKGVNETSIWYDPSTGTVYAIGDISLPTNNVSIQVGTVDAAAHAIKWAPSDSSLSTSTVPMAGKNTYITKDANGYLWVLSSNCTSDKPGRYWLNAFKSRDVNNTHSWADTGQMLPWYITTDNAKGTIVPAGSGSDVWAVYIYAGYVSGRKYNGTWGADQRIYTLFGSTANTDNSPPSVVVDKKGVVHVVLGSGLRVGGGGGISTPEIMYYHNNTDQTSFTTGLNLDPNVPKGVGGYYPTISLDTSTGDLYVLWLQNVLGDPAYAPRTVIGRKCVSGTWSNMTIEPQTTFAKQYLTSIYSVSGEFKICWQWTQNATAPIEVLFDRTVIPEFSVLTVPLIGSIVILATYARRSRREDRIPD